MIWTGLLLWIATAAPSGAADALARVDDVTITRADLDERMRVLGRRQVAPADAVETLVQEALLAAEARRLGLDRDPVVASDIEMQRRRLVSEAYVDSLAASYKVSEAELRRMYHSSGDQVRLTLVKFTSEADARAAFERVKAGGDLAAEARRSADAATAANGGDTGSQSRAMLDPALAEAAFRAPLGSLVGPIQLKLGWAVARVVERTIADDSGFAGRREALAEMARTRGVAELRAHVIARLRQGSGVKLDEPFLSSLGSRLDVTPAELEHVIATVNGRPVRYAAIHPAVAQLFRTVRGHGIGARARIEVAWKDVEARLLADEAVAQGLDRSPQVSAVLPGIERHVLAAAAAARIGKAADLRDPAVRGRVDALRRGAKVQIERGRVAAYQRPP